MKKILCLLVLVVMGTFIATASASVEYMPLFSMTSSEIDAMDTYMNYGWGAVSGKWFYGNVKLKKQNAQMGKMRLSDTSDRIDLKVEKNSYLDLSVHDGWIYWLRYDNKTKLVSEIKKATISGDNVKTIATASKGAEFNNMFIYDDHIYYAENISPKNGPVSGKLYRMDLNGSGKTLILNKPAYAPYAIEGKILYQDDRDRNRLHICDLDGSNDRVLIDDVVFTYITDGLNIYYKTHSVPGSFDRYGNYVSSSSAKDIIKVYNMGSKETETVIKSNTFFWGLHDNVIYYSNLDDSGRLYTYDLRDGSIDIMLQDKNTYPCVFTSNGLFCEVLNNKGNSTIGRYFIYYDTYKKVDLFK